MPTSRAGVISAAVGYPGRIYVAVNAGAGKYSSVLCYQGGGWHEVYRSPFTGSRIRSLFIQTTPGTTVSKLWIGDGQDVLWVPICSGNPYFDTTGYLNTWEGTLETGWIVSGMKDVYKLYKSVKVFADSLSATVTIDLYYMTDTDTSYTKVTGTFDTSPVEEIDLTSDDSLKAKKLRLRFVLKTNSLASTLRVSAWVLEYLLRVPPKYQYTMRFKASDGVLTLEEIEPDDPSVRIETNIAKLKA